MTLGRFGRGRGPGLAAGPGAIPSQIDADRGFNGVGSRRGRQFGLNSVANRRHCGGELKQSGAEHRPGQVECKSIGINAAVQLSRLGGAKIELNRLHQQLSSGEITGDVSIDEGRVLADRHRRIFDRQMAGERRPSVGRTAGKLAGYPSAGRQVGREAFARQAQHVQQAAGRNGG